MFSRQLFTVAAFLLAGVVHAASGSNLALADLVRPLYEDLKKPEFSQSRCLLAPVLATDKRTVAMSRTDTFHHGDRILAINGEALRANSDRGVHDILIRYPPDATVTVRVQRAGSQTQIAAPCSDSQSFYSQLRAAATAAVQDDAATCADRMVSADKLHSLGSSWLKVSLYCQIKAGRIAGPQMLAAQFGAFHEELLENDYSSDALQAVGPVLQTGAQQLLAAGSRPLAETLQQEYVTAAAKWASLPGSVRALPDPTVMHCAITQYQQWVHAQTAPPDPDVKARKLQEIDDLCGSSLHFAHVQSGYEAALSNAAAVKQSGVPNIAAPNAAAPAARAVATAPTVQSTETSGTTSDGWPIAPEKHLPLIRSIPAHDQIVLEVRFKNHTGVPDEIAVFDLTTRTESKWDVLSDALHELPATSFGSQAAWAPGVGKLLYATHKSVHLVSTDGSASELHLQMPSNASLLNGMSAYAISADGQHVAYTLNTRDRSQLQTDGFGKLYTDLMVQKSEGSPPISVWNDRSALLESAWRPDGAAIAHTDAGHNLVVSDLNGKTLWSFHPGPPTQGGSIADFIQEIRWDPSGQRLAFLMGFPILKMYVVNADGSGIKALEFRNFFGTDPDLSIAKFAWSPDGRKFVFRTEAGSKCNYLALGYKINTGHYPCIYSWNLITADVDGSHMSKAIASPDYEFGELFWIQ